MNPRGISPSVSAGSAFLPFSFRSPPLQSGYCPEFLHARFARPARQSSGTHETEVLRLNSTKRASHSVPNHTFASGSQVPAYCAETVRAKRASHDFDQPTSQLLLSKRSRPNDVRSSRSDVKKRPSSGRHNAALRRKLFETRPAYATVDVLETPG